MPGIARAISLSMYMRMYHFVSKSQCYYANFQSKQSLQVTQDDVQLSVFPQALTRVICGAHERVVLIYEELSSEALYELLYEVKHEL